jgi:hypothetical protein
MRQLAEPEPEPEKQQSVWKDLLDITDWIGRS